MQYYCSTNIPHRFRESFLQYICITGGRFYDCHLYQLTTIRTKVQNAQEVCALITFIYIMDSRGLAISCNYRHTYYIMYNPVVLIEKKKQQKSPKTKHHQKAAKQNAKKQNIKKALKQNTTKKAAKTKNPKQNTKNNTPKNKTKHQKATKQNTTKKQ